VLALPFLLHQSDAPFSKVMENGTTVTRIYSKDTYYGNLKVVDYSYGPKRHRELMIDGLVQGGIDLSDGMSVYGYAYFLEFLPYGVNPSGRSCLVIGLGAGVIPVWYEQRGIRTDVVDVDPYVVEIARNYFGFSLSGDMIVADARYYLNTTDKRYDYIILDVFNGDTTPGHVLSVEALRLVKERLTDRGILAINLIGSLTKDNFMTSSIIRTLQRVFATVTLYPNFDPEAGDGNGNITVLAYNAALPPFDRSLVASFPVHRFPTAEVNRFLGRTYTLPPDTPAVVLTDDYNPIDFYDVGLKEWLRRNILDGVDLDVLI